MDRETLRNVYGVVYDNFAVSKSEIASDLGIDKRNVSLALEHLEGAGLVTSTDVNDEAQGAARRGQFKELVWQCWKTYDSVSKEESEATFAEAFPHPASVGEYGKLADDGVDPKAEIKANTQ
jgi:DNA-binding transcriptional regulator GbsR (MarR family)